MMNTLRSKQKAIMWILVIIITPAFILWGVSTTSNSGQGKTVVAVVNNETVQYPEFYNQFAPRYEQTLKMYESYFGVLDKRQKASIYNNVAVEAVNTIINQRILIDYAKKLGFSVSTDEIKTELIRQLSQYDIVKTEGVFDEKKFNEWLKNVDEAQLAQFESDIRTQLLNRKAYEYISRFAQVSNDEITAAYLDKNRTVTFGYSSADIGEYLPKVTLSEDEINKYYQDQKETYRLPTKLSIDYVIVAPAYIAGTMQVSDDEAQKYYDKNNDEFMKDEVNVEYIRIPIADYMSKVTVSASDIADYYSKNKNDYNKGKRVKIEYAALRVNDFTKTLTVTDQEVTSYFEDNKETYKLPETVRARHILIRVLPSESSVVKKEKRAKAQEALKELKSGKDFVEMVKKYSDASGDNNGDVGYFKRDDMVKPFSDAAFKLKTGEISGIVETEFGYHIIKLEDKKPASYQDIKDPAVRTSIETNIKMKKGRTALDAKKSEIQGKMASLKDLNSFARENGMTLVSTDLMTREEFLLKVVRNDAQADLVFASSNGIMLPLYADENSVIIMKVIDTESNYYTPLTAVRGTIEEKLKKDKALELAQKQATVYYEELKKAGAELFTQKAQEMKLMPAQTGFFGSGYNDFIPGIGTDANFRRAAFNLDYAAIPEPVVLQGDAIVIMHLVEKRPNYTPEFKMISAQVQESVKLQKASKKTASIAAKIKRSISDKGFDEKVLTSFGLRAQKMDNFDDKNVPDFINRMETPEAVEKTKKELFNTKKNGVMKPIRIGDNYVIVRVTERQESAIQELAAVRSDVEMKLRRLRAIEMIKTELSSQKHTAVKTMKVSEPNPMFSADDIKKIASSKDTTVIEKGSVLYHINDIAVDNEVVKNMTPEEKATFKNQIQSQKQEYIFQKWLEEARKKAHVKNFIQKFLQQE